MKLQKTMCAFATIAACAIFSTFTTSCVVRQYPAAKRSVNVRGTGSVAVEADRALIKLSVITTAPEAGTAATQNAERMKNVQEAIIAAGCQKENISTENYSIYQEYDYENNRRVAGDYRVSNDIKVYLKEKELASTIIDAAIKAGANNLSSLTFSVSNPEDAIRKARTQAVQNARESAKLIAGTAGAELGRVLDIKELNDNYSAKRAFPVYNAMFEGTGYNDAASTDTPVTSGKITFDVTVDATFELK